MTSRPCSHSSPPGDGGGVSPEWQQRSAVWTSTLSSRDKFTLLAILDFDRSARGVRLFPSLQRIAKMTGYAYSTVRQAVGALENAGILKAIGHRPSQYGSRGRVTEYLFHADCLPDLGQDGRPTPAPVDRDSCREPAPVDGDSRRKTAPVERDGCRLPAPVNLPQVVRDERAGAILAIDSRRFSARQVPEDGNDRTYERTEDRTEERSTPRASHEAPTPTNEEAEDKRLRDTVLRQLRTKLGVAPW